MQIVWSNRQWMQEFNLNIQEPRIFPYNRWMNRYKVKFDDGKGGEYIDNIPVSNLRGRYPTRMSAMEKEFFEKQK